MSYLAATLARNILVWSLPVSEILAISMLNPVANISGNSSSDPTSGKLASSMLEASLPEVGSLLLLPEMFATGFSMDIAKISETGNDHTKMFLASVAAKYDIYVQGGLVTTAPDGRGRNEAAVFAPDGREIARYHKLHPFSYGGETNCYAPGENMALFSWGEVTVAPFICYDLRFPEIFR